MFIAKSYMASSCCCCFSFRFSRYPPKMFHNINLVVEIIIAIGFLNRRWSAWDSNPGPQDGGRRRNHGAMAATLGAMAATLYSNS